MNPRRVFLASLLVIALLALAGCGMIAEKATEELTEKAIEGSTGGNVEIDEGEVTVKGEDGSSATFSEEGEVPEDFPKDVPIYDGKVITSLKTDTSYMLGIETTDDAATIYDWYAEEIEKEGWTLATQMKTEGGGLFGAEKGDQGLNIAFGFDDSTSKATITITVGEKTQ